MFIPDLELHESRSLDEAGEMLARYGPDVSLLAGGTDLLVDLKAGRRSVAHLVSINRIEALHGVTATDGGLRVGALTTITQLAQSPHVSGRFAPILDATREMAAEQIRNVATVGGNIASAVPCADLPPILMTFNASAALWSPGGERRVPLREFFVGPRQTVLATDEVLVAINIPHPPAGFGAAYERFALRDGNAIAVAAVAAGVRLDENEVVCEASIVLGAVAPIPKRADEAAAILIGRRLDDDAIEQAAAAARQAAEPISDVRGTAEYRRELVGVLTPRALKTAGGRARD